MPKIGGHNCGKLAPIYLEPDQEGRRLVEIIRDHQDNLMISININNMKYAGGNSKKYIMKYNRVTAFLKNKFIIDTMNIKKNQKHLVRVVEKTYMLE